MTNTGTGSNSSRGRHARALLEALFQQQQQHGWVLQPPPVSPSSPRRASTKPNHAATAVMVQAFKPTKPSSLAASASSRSSDEDDEPEGEGHREQGPSESLSGEELEMAGQGTPKGKESTGYQGANGCGGTASSSRCDQGAEEEAATVARPEDPIADVLDSLQGGRLDEEDTIDKLRDKLDRHVAAAVQRTGNGLVLGLTSSQLDSLVLDLLHRHREDENPSGCAFPAPPTLASLISQPGCSSSSSNNGSGNGGGGGHRPPSLRSSANTTASLARPWMSTRLSSFQGQQQQPSSASSSTGAFPPLGSVGLGGEAGLSPGAIGSLPGSPGSSRPGTPTGAKNSMSASMGMGTGGLVGGVAASIAADSDPIIHPSSRSSSIASFSYLHNSNSSSITTGGSPRPWARPLSGASTNMNGGASSSNLHSGSPSSFNSSIGGIGFAGGLYATAIGASAGAGSGFGAQYGSNSSNSLSVATPPRPTSPLLSSSTSTTSTSISACAKGGAVVAASPRLNIAASEFQPKSTRSANSSVSSSPLARHRGATGATGAMTVSVPPWFSASSASVAGGSASSAGSSSAGAPSSFGAGPGTVWGASSSGTAALPLAGSALAAGGGAEEVQDEEEDDDDDDDDEFSPFGTAAAMSSSRRRQLRLPQRAGSSDVPGWYSSGNSAASDAGRSEDGAGALADAMESPLDATMTPFDVLFSILIGKTTAGGSSGEADVSATQDAPQWTPEKVEEALAINNWDVEETLKMIISNQGEPLLPQPQPAASASSVSASSELHPGPIFTPKGQDVPANSGLNPKLYFPAGPKGFARGGSSGVQVMSVDAFAGAKPIAAVGSSPRPSFAQAQHSPSAIAANPPPVISPSAAGSVGASRVCRYYLAGECRRADCRFSHDLGRALCRFWLKGQCLNDPCSFLHDYDVVNSLASGIASSASISGGNNGSAYGGEGGASSASTSEGPETPLASAEDFPSLSGGGGDMQSSGYGPGKAPSAPAWQTLSKRNTNDASRTRWAQALQRKNVPPALAAVRAGERAFVPGSARNAPTSAAPTQPLLPPSAPLTRPSPSRIALRAPSLLPTLSVGRSAASAYAAHRSGTLALSDGRNRALAKAGEAWRRGDGAAARAWSQEGTALNARLAEESKTAAQALLRERHAELRERLLNSGSDGGGWGTGAAASDEPGAKGMRGKLVGAGLGVCLGVARKEGVPGGAKLAVEERVECLLDLHGLHAIEAVEMAEVFLLGLERENLRGLAYLAVGEGRHSARVSARDGDRRRMQLSGAVKQFLASWGYPFASVEGVLVVDPCTHLT
ncbi:hypothetical protein K437DRAFT_269738 [Tilletiaria anomala UBC 951]|uniref:CCCH zinc finger and SMR domain containing protein n=1 Tax=Tilletiaria anomala (strain ATCC 24038 / CBS 436.72 / UBC 951) TaxID=1037660 RepID=A0A066VIQ8_TILAU|nr:uncharacterized protein K437DRAFT_269738 [Tilletiaria anomala UBC 951]KDN41341.1 hypothetical protein K437DRAFT_269738 [Tilletiaria anomala UBC 951]